MALRKIAVVSVLSLLFVPFVTACHCHCGCG